MSEVRSLSGDRTVEQPAHRLAPLPEPAVDTRAPRRRPNEPVLRAGIRAGALGFFLVAALYTTVGVIAGLGIGGGLGVGVFVGIWGGVGWGAMAGTSLLVMKDHGPQHVVATVPVNDQRTTRRES
jgi:hypothetical protein